MARLLVLTLLPLLAWAGSDHKLYTPKEFQQAHPELVDGLIPGHIRDKINGKSSASSSPFIIGGSAADISQVPYLVAIEMLFVTDEGAEWVHTCMGTIIRPDVILTGASCNYVIDVILPTTVRVRAGSSTTLNGGETRLVLKTKRHEQFLIGLSAGIDEDTLSMWYYNDVSVMFLSSPLPVGEGNIQLIEIANPDFVPESTSCLAAGWSIETLVEPLEAVELSAINLNTCRNLLLNYLLRDDMHMCTFDGSGATGMCASWGTPLVCNDGGVPVQAGISSFQQFIEPADCSTVAPYGWARITGPLHDWVIRSIENA